MPKIPQLTCNSNMPYNIHSTKTTGACTLKYRPRNGAYSKAEYNQPRI